MIVVDASALVELLLARPLSAAIGRRIGVARETLHAPHVVDVEVGHAVRRLHRQGAIDDSRGRAALDDLRAMRLTRYPQQHLLRRAWALRENLTFYDAVYLALAEALDAPLLTLDVKLAGAPVHRAVIEVVSSND